MDSVLPAGDTVYVGGQFTMVGPCTGSGVPVDATSGLPQAGFAKVDGWVNVTIPDGGGGFYIGGDFSSVGGMTRDNLAHILADGTVDPGWDPDANGAVGGLAVSGSTVYAAGYFTSIGGQDRNYVAALDAATGDATGWNPDADGSAWALAVSGSTVYVGGDFTSIGGQDRNYIAALDAGTGDATAWNPDSGGSVWALAASASTVYAAGDFTSIGGADRTYVAALDAGTGDATDWNADPDDYVDVLAVSGSGATVYAGGDFTSIGGQDRNHIAALDAGTGDAADWNPDANSSVRGLAVSGSTVYAGGYFTSIGGEDRAYIAALDVDSGMATDWNPSADRSVSAIAVSGSTVYLGGDFNSIGAVIRHNLAAFDAGTGSATDWDPDITGSSSSPAVYALAVSGSTVYAGGRFTTVNGSTPREDLAAFDAGTGSATAWSPDLGFGGYDVYVFALSVSGSTLYVGGQFSSVDATTRHNLAAFDTGSGSLTAWNPDVTAAALGSPVRALAVSGSTVYAGGYFTTVNGSTTRNHLAAFDATSGDATAWDPDVDEAVYALAVSGSTVYAGGDFKTVNGTTTRNHLAAFDATSGDATAWNPDANARVKALAVTGSSVYAGGYFTTVNGGTTRNYLTSFDAGTGVVTDWNPNPDKSLTALAASSTAPSVLWAGGEFRTIGNRQLGGVAEFEPLADATTLAATAVTTTSATLNGTVNPQGLATTYHFEYGTSASYGSQTDDQSAGSGASDQPVSADITGLQPSTTYHFRVAATNANGTAYGSDQTFTTAAIGGIEPVVSTTAATGITASAATLNGTVNPEGQTTTYHFDYGTSTGYGSRIPAADATAGSDSVNHTVSQTVSGLQPNTTYHYRVVAANGSGTTNGADQTFTTSAISGIKPVVSTGAATGITTSDATLNGTVNPENQSTTYHFDYGMSTGYGSRIPAADATAGSDSANHAVSQTLSGLEPNTTYHFRIVAANGSGTTNGADQTFTTNGVVSPPGNEPVVSTGVATGIDGDGATLHGTVNPRGQPTTYHFDYGKTAAYGSHTTHRNAGSDTSDHQLSRYAAGLLPSTRYHYRIVATNAAGTSHGADRTFRTAPRVWALRIIPAGFRAQPGGASILHTDTRGAKVGYRISGSATVTFKIEHVLRGRRSGMRCLPDTAARHMLPRCTRYVRLAGSFRHAGKAGLNTFVFTGRLHGETLLAGKYRLVATARDSTGKLSDPVRFAFTIRR